jgi:uncharacterized membrane protein
MIQQSELMAAQFADPSMADRCLQQLKQMEKDGSIDLIDAAVLVKNPDGKLKIDELKELTTGKGARRGAIIGGIFGVIFPPSLLASAAIGAAAGGVLGRLRDEGMKNEDLKAIGEDLPSGHSAIVAIVEDKWIEQFTRGVEGYDKLSRMSLDAETVGTLIDATNTETGESVDILAARDNTAGAASRGAETAASSATTASEGAVGDKPVASDMSEGESTASNA